MSTLSRFKLRIYRKSPKEATIFCQSVEPLLAFGGFLLTLEDRMPCDPGFLRFHFIGKCISSSLDEPEDAPVVLCRH